MDLSPVDVSDLIDRLDLEQRGLKSGGRELNFGCPGPEHSDGGSAYINITTTAWFCHGCKRRGNAVNLVMESHAVDRPQAERTLREWYGIAVADPVGGSMVAEIEQFFARREQREQEPVRPSRSLLTMLGVDWDYERATPAAYATYMFERGFFPATLAAWDVGYDFETNRLAIPVFDVDGGLVGIKARSYVEGHVPKYLVLGDTAGQTRFGYDIYDPSTVVFGLHRNRHVRTAVVCEGELNALALSQLGVPRPVATGMSYFTNRHAELLAREVDEAVLYYDAGSAGHAGVWGSVRADGSHQPGAVALLEPYMRVRVAQPLPEDPAELMALDRGPEALLPIAEARSSLELAMPSVFG